MTVFNWRAVTPQEGMKRATSAPTPSDLARMFELSPIAHVQNIKVRFKCVATAIEVRWRNKHSKCSCGDDSSCRTAMLSPGWICIAMMTVTCCVAPDIFPGVMIGLGSR